MIDCSGRAAPRAGRAAAVGVIAAMACAGLVSCSSLSPDAAAAADTAVAFHRAVADGNGPAACDQLAPETVAVLAQDSGQPCAEALLDEDIPDADTVLEQQAYGQVAQIVLDGDVVFLAAFGDGWRVTAAGCTARDNRPYHCSIDGG